MTDKEPDFRLRYNRNLPEPNRLVVWDVKNNKEYTTSHFDLTGCRISMFYGNSIKQEKRCGAKLILEVWKQQ